MIEYCFSCPICGQCVRSYDSNADARADLDLHLLNHHPDDPDPTFDPRFPERTVGGEE